VLINSECIGDCHAHKDPKRELSRCRIDDALGFVDRRDMRPSVISTATIETVASWFDGLTVEGTRRRLRANVEVSGVPAFWEDRFVGAGAPSFEADGSASRA
jgi:uncharacterized protein YcbX